MPAFSLTTSEGRPLTPADLRGHVTAITFVFTRCPVAEFCPLMVKRFQELQRKLESSDSQYAVRLLSVTLDPAFDTPQVLRDYATSKGANPARWQFATGDPERDHEAHVSVLDSRRAERRPHRPHAGDRRHRPRRPHRGDLAWERLVDGRAARRDPAGVRGPEVRGDGVRGEEVRNGSHGDTGFQKRSNEANGENGGLAGQSVGPSLRKSARRSAAPADGLAHWPSAIPDVLRHAGRTASQAGAHVDATGTNSQSIRPFAKSMTPCHLARGLNSSANAATRTPCGQSDSARECGVSSSAQINGLFIVAAPCGVDCVCPAGATARFAAGSARADERVDRRAHQEGLAERRADPRDQLRAARGGPAGRAQRRRRPAAVDRLGVRHRRRRLHHDQRARRERRAARPGRAAGRQRGRDAGDGAVGQDARSSPRASSASPPNWIWRC